MSTPPRARRSPHPTAMRIETASSRDGANVERRRDMRLITVSSRALGERVKVVCYVYDSLAEMRRAASAYNDSDQHDALAVTQARTDEDGRAVSVLIRLSRGHLGTQIVVHEMHHAATALYGATLDDKVQRVEHFTHYNEPFAHLQSDLTCRLVDRLYALGYYQP